jgi:hypothetical protein
MTVVPSKNIPPFQNILRGEEFAFNAVNGQRKSLALCSAPLSVKVLILGRK